MELVKDYDCEILYYPDKANKVAEALSRKSTTTLMSLQVLPKELQDEVCSLGVEILVGKLSTLTLQPTILDGIKGGQELDPSLFKIKKEVLEGKRTDFEVSVDEVLGFKGRLCVPTYEELKQQIMHEAHNTPYSVHPGTTKMYQDLKGLFWWPGMKRDVVKYVEKYLTCQIIRDVQQVNCSQ